ncbi:hypothetical protein QAD02_021122 [Eretmocerus hayati]|uniref:Uncharacterized protein n=1 Tax=Eretmocerus hayati TaxID=131215 RepID=A0ACC2PP08_9HYME|nr:hypothetical protein QAD02_021122 [Eretmocerus hayati]
MNKRPDKLSGAQYKNNAKRKHMREEKILDATPKLENFFSVSVTPSEEDDTEYYEARSHLSTQDVNIAEHAQVTEESESRSTRAGRGSDSEFGSLHNGNYIMALGILAEYDPFLRSHMEKYANKGSGSVSHLSATIRDEFISLMAQNVRETIANGVRKAGPYSMSTDSTPDISHTDQSTSIIRHINSLGIPVERSLGSIARCGHTGQQIAEAELALLRALGIDIMDCKAQSYDNAANMSGAYSRAHSRMRRVNPDADYIPCSGHSLNLVGENVASSCPEAVRFFCAMQGLYNFCTASAPRWQLFLKELRELQKSARTLKNPSETR